MLTNLTENKQKDLKMWMDSQSILICFFLPVTLFFLQFYDPHLKNYQQKILYNYKSLKKITLYCITFKT